MVAGWAAIATAIQETSHAPQGMANGKAGDGKVGGMPQRQAVIASKKSQCGRGQQKPPVENQSALIDADHFKGCLAIVGPVGDDIGNSRSDYAASHEPKTEIGSKAGRACLATFKPKPSQNGAKESGGRHNAIAVDFLAKNLEQNWVHSGRP